MYSIFSVDVEEWFHLLETDVVYKNHADWDRYEGRIEKVFESMLSLLDRHQVKATLFFLGWIAEKHPELVKKAHSKGHEIAAHGYYHDLIYDQTYDAFYNEIFRTKALLEKITGEKVLGYRAPGFSLTQKTVWAYKALMDLGFEYSSSVFPAARAHGSYKDFGIMPAKIFYEGKSIIEFPMTILKFPLTPFSCFGGGYFRLFPLAWYEIAASQVLKQNRPLIFYIHPRDMDPDQPVLKVPLHRKIKSYINIKKTEGKLDRMLANRQYTSFRQILRDGGAKAIVNTASLDMSRGWESASLANFTAG